MNNQKPKTAKDQRKHFQRRLRERYNIKLNRKGVSEVIRIIRSGRQIASLQQSNRVTKHLIRFREQFMIVVYDKTRNTVVTVLPVGAQEWREISQMNINHNQLKNKTIAEELVTSYKMDSAKSNKPKLKFEGKEWTNYENEN